MLCYVMLCYVMLCYVMLCYFMLWYAMLCCVVLCCIVLCFEGVWLATTPVRTTTGGAHGPVVDSEAVPRDTAPAGPNCNIHTTTNEYPRRGKHSYTLRFILVSRHRALSR